MSGSPLSSYFDYKGAANAPMPSNSYDYKPDPGIFGGSAPNSGSAYSPTPGGFNADEWLKDKNPYAYKPKSFLDKFTDALNQGADNARKFNQQQQEKDKEKSIATPSSMSGGNVQQLTDNFTALFPQTFSPFTVAGVQGEPGIGGKLLSAAAPLLGMIPGVGPVLAAGASVGSSLLG
jgi:hypothetical protein